MYVLIALVVLLAIYVVGLYNSLVRKRQMAREGWSGIDVQLKRRADLVPGLVEAVKGYVTHERSTFAEVVAARNEALKVDATDVAGRAVAENALSASLGKLFALAEEYPDLKASANFLELQTALGTVEHDLQMARRYYNGAARELNVRVESFPSNLVAGSFGFEQRAYFEIEDAGDRARPSVQF
ncbi:LemA family protein [Yangia sp. PrR003]|nr:LemA family protein [Salipiger sp. PrR003]